MEVRVINHTLLPDHTVAVVVVTTVLVVVSRFLLATLVVAAASIEVAATDAARTAATVAVTTLVVDAEVVVGQCQPSTRRSSSIRTQSKWQKRPTSQSTPSRPSVSTDVW